MLSGKTILVTGASGGIGTVLVGELLNDDANVIAVDVSREGLSMLAEAHGRARRLRCVASDLGDEESARKVAEDIGALYGLVHLAGIFVPDEMRHGDTEAIFDPVMQANTRNIYSLFIAARRSLLAGDEAARVIVVSSLAFNRGAPAYTAYSAAKGALVGLTRSLARREAPDILVNAVAPGFIDTTMPRQLLRERGIDSVLAEIPLQRLGRPQDVSSLIRFLLSPDAGYITGQLINVDGGIVCS